MSKRHKPYDQMNTAELREATREFDREMIDAPGKPLTPAQRKMHRDAAASAAKKRKVGRPPKGAGTTVVAVSVESDVLKKADALAKRRKVPRSELFNEALKQLLSHGYVLASAGKGAIRFTARGRAAATPAAK